jgi:excisionase family DNA binding protein
MTVLSRNPAESQPKMAAATLDQPAPPFPPTHHARFYSYCQVAEIFGRSPRTIRHWVKTGLLKAIRVGAARLISEAEISRVITGDAPFEALDNNVPASTGQCKSHQ